MGSDPHSKKAAVNRYAFIRFLFTPKPSLEIGGSRTHNDQIRKLLVT
jgi:hypothetical protein